MYSAVCISRPVHVCIYALVQCMYMYMYAHSMLCAYKHIVTMFSSVIVGGKLLVERPSVAMDIARTCIHDVGVQSRICLIPHATPPSPLSPQSFSVLGWWDFFFFACDAKHLWKVSLFFPAMFDSEQVCAG